MHFSKIAWKITTGFVLAALILIAPLLLILLPLFGPLILGFMLPVWSVATVPVVILGFLVTGQLYRAVGALVLAASLLSFPPVRDYVLDSVETDIKYIYHPRQHAVTEAECSSGYMELKRPNTKPGRVIFDNIVGSVRYGGYDPAKLTAALANVEVIEINDRSRMRHYFASAWATRADRSDTCTDINKGSNELGPYRFSSGRGEPQRLRTNVCFMHKAVPDPSQDRSAAIIFRSDPKFAFASGCSAVDVLERTGDGDVLLGRVRYYEANSSLYPELRRHRNGDNGAWFRAILSKVLGSDIDIDNATIVRLFAEPIAEKSRSVLRQALNSHNFDAAAVKAGTDFFGGIGPNRKIEGQDLDIAKLLLTDERFPVPFQARAAVQYTKGAPPDYFDTIGAAMFGRLRATASADDGKRGSAGNDAYHIADVISALPRKTILQHYEDLEWLTRQRVRPRLAMQRLADFGAMAAPTFLWLIDDSQRFSERWKSDWGIRMSAA